MATEAWKGFIHSWHTLGIVLKWMCMVVIGIPFAIATCILVGLAALVFFGLCLIAAALAGAFVFYFFKGLGLLVIHVVKRLKDPQATTQTLPTTTNPKASWWRAPKVPLTQLATKRTTSSDPPGYIYPWYEGEPEVPAPAHLSPTEESPAPRPASSIPSVTEDSAHPTNDVTENIRGHQSVSDELGNESEDQFPDLELDDMIPYCRVCKKAKLLLEFPSRKITTRCTHLPECCLACLSKSITTDYKGSTWQRICCPLCNLRLQRADVKEFASEAIYQEYVDDTTILFLDQGEMVQVDISPLAAGFREESLEKKERLKKEDRPSGS